MKVLIDISSACPHKCIYCAHQHLGLVEPELMDEAMFYRIVDILTSEGIDGVYPYMSGEPFSHPKALQFLKYLAPTGMTVNIATKVGVRLNHEAFESMIRCYQDNNRTLHMEITMPSLRDETMIQEFVTCNPQVIRDNIQMIMEMARKYPKTLDLTFITILTDANRSEIDSIGNYFQSRGFRWVTKTAGYWLNVKPTGVSQPRRVTANQPCAFISHPAISPKGNVTICCHDFLFQLTLGNVVEEGSFMKIFVSPEYQSAKALGRDRALPLCKGCV